MEISPSPTPQKGALLEIKFFVQPSWNKHHKELWLSLPTPSLDSLKRYILQKVHSTSSNIDRHEFTIQYMGMDMPIFYEEDLHMILGDLVQDPETVFIMKINRIVQKRQAKRQFEFDEVGTVNPTLENNGDVILNRPSDKMYFANQEVTCAFCRVSNKDKGAIKDLGPFYGPYKNKDKSFYVHELCAIWTPEVYLDAKTDKMKNLVKEVKRCNKMTCSHCGVHGGGLGCLNRTCKKTYHFRCCLDEDLDCQLDYNAHTMMCPEHAEKEDDIDVEKIFCKVCDLGHDEHLCIICDKCVQGYHTYCLKPALKKIPEGKWFCPNCANGAIEEDDDEEDNEMEIEDKKPVTKKVVVKKGNAKKGRRKTDNAMEIESEKEEMIPVKREEGVNYFDHGNDSERSLGF